MRKPAKVVIVSQHFAPDPSTTAAIMTTIAIHIARETQVLLVSGTSGSESCCLVNTGVEIIEIKNERTGKAELVKRAVAELLFSLRVFFVLLFRLKRNDVVLTVTAPFLLPYAVSLSAKLRRSRSALILHDLYPEVLVMAGVVRPSSIVTKAIHIANALMYRCLDAVITIGRDTERLLLRYKGISKEKLHFIPNWATLPIGVRPLNASNRYRGKFGDAYIVGLSGNLGFTHDPIVVFEAAKLLRENLNIHFLLSGWGMGFEQLQSLQENEKLPNVTIVGRVPENDLEEFLSAADTWIIPYKKNVAGVSVPSRFYNLLAIGRPVIIISEPEAEAALTLSEYNLGWISSPGDATELARTIELAYSAANETESKQERATAVAQQFSLDQAMQRYQNLIAELLCSRA